MGENWINESSSVLSEIVSRLQLKDSRTLAFSLAISVSECICSWGEGISVTFSVTANVCVPDSSSLVEIYSLDVLPESDLTGDASVSSGQRKTSIGPFVLLREIWIF